MSDSSSVTVDSSFKYLSQARHQELINTYFLHPQIKILFIHPLGERDVQRYTFCFTQHTEVQTYVIDLSKEKVRVFDKGF